MLKLHNLHLGYEKKILLKNISADVPAGSFVGLLGVNGIGKSTLLKCVAGLLNPKFGYVGANNENVHQLDVARKSKLISFAGTERVDIIYMTVREFVALGKMRFANSFNLLPAQHLNHVEEVIAGMQLSHLSAKYIGEISDGERQKAVVARAVAQDTQLLILDEPTAFLDFKNKRSVFKFLAALARQKQKIILVSTHDLECSFESCNHWWVLDEQQNFHASTNAGDARTFLQLNH